MVERITKNIVILLLAYAVQLCATQDAQQIFLRANKEYHAGNFQKARELYRSLENKGHAAWYNLGNCLYQLKEYPAAIAAWRRAQVGASLQELHTIEYNINCAREQAGYPEIKYPGWYRVWHDSIMLVPVGLSQLLFLITWYLMIWLVLFGRNTKGIVAMLLITGLLCIMLWSGLALYVHYQESGYKKAVVHKQTEVYAGPHDGYHVVGELVCTDELTIKEQRTGWCKIMHDQTYGWVPIYNITII